MFRENSLYQPPSSSSWVDHLMPGGKSQGFRPWGDDAAIESADEPMSAPEAEAETVAAVDSAVVRAEAFAAGFEEGRRSLEAEIAGEREGIVRLAKGLTALAPEPAEPLAALLAETVERLVREIVGTAEIDGDLLCRRASQAAALIGEETEPARLFVHPGDLPLLEDAELAVELAPDPNLVRGSVRLERASGWIEDGPEVRLDRLRAALTQLGASE